jgi:hypothetical protein
VNKDNYLHREEWFEIYDTGGYWRGPSYCKPASPDTGGVLREHARALGGRHCIACGAVWVGEIPDEGQEGEGN